MTTHRDSLINRVLVQASLRRPSSEPTSSTPLDIAWRWWTGEEGGVIHFIVLENIIPPQNHPTELYDLKGSTLGRTAAAEEKKKARESGRVVILKDLDVQRCIHLTREMSVLLLKTLKADLKWLRNQNCMDYSLLLAVCPVEEKESLSVSAASSACCTCCGGQNLARRPCPKCQFSVCSLCCDPSRQRLVCHLCYGFESCPILGSQTLPQQSAPFRKQSLFRSYDGGFRSTSSQGAPRPEMYFVGIIDFLQPFNIRKQVEQKVKTHLLAGGDALQISVLQPDLYAERLFEFVRRLITPIILPADVSL